jgi:hypothetical protein
MVVKIIRIAGLLVLMSAWVLASEGANSSPAAPLLPNAFSGWQKSNARTSTDPGVADSANASVMREYGFTDFESATYTQSDRRITIKAARFNDASGAYGAFTFYRLPEMLNEKFGDQGASLNNRVLFYRGNVLVQATLDRVTAMTAAELRELSAAIPLPSGPAANLPTLPQYLPKQGYLKNSARYVMGPAGLSAVGTPVSVEQIGFNRSAEVVEGKYSTANGTATLMIVGYPTPQIAGEQLRAFGALNQNASPQGDPTFAPPFTMKRTGPMLVLVAGQISPAEAKSLLGLVNYSADVTWNENTALDKKNDVGSLLVNIILLIFILVGFALVIGIAFGGVRLLIQRFYPGRVFDRPEDVEIIQLKLRK